MKEGFWWKLTWVFEALLLLVGVAIAMSISALFNIYPSWQQEWMLGVAQLAMLVVMAAIPIFILWDKRALQILIKSPTAGLAVYLCWLLWLGAGEQISRARDSVFSGDEGLIKTFDAYRKTIEEKKGERDGYVSNLKWRVGSQEKVDSAKTLFDSASKKQENTCKLYPVGKTCRDDTAAYNTAQGALNEANDLWGWTKGKARLDIEIPKLEQEQRDLHAPVDNPQKVAAARSATYMQKFGINLTEKEVNDRRPLDIAAAGEIMSLIGPQIMFSIIHNFFSGIRAWLRRKEEDEQPKDARKTEIHLPMVPSFADASIELDEPVHKPMQPMYAPMQSWTNQEQNETEVVLKAPSDDTFWEFAKAHLMKTGGRIEKNKVLTKYRSFCADRGEQAHKDAKVGRLLEAFGSSKTKKDSRNYYGIALKTELTLVKSMQHA